MLSIWSATKLLWLVLFLVSSLLPGYNTTVSGRGGVTQKFFLQENKRSLSSIDLAIVLSE